MSEVVSTAAPGAAVGAKRNLGTTFWLERNTLRVASVVVLLAVWELVGLQMESFVLPTPVEVAVAWWKLLLSGELLEASWASILVFISGFGAALVLGIPLGIATGASRPLGYFFDTYITVFWSTPTIALLPMLVVWFGLTFETKVVLVFLSGFWPLVINTQVGIQNVDKSLIEVATAFGATHFLESTDAVKDVLANGVDFAFECVGHVKLIRASIDLLDWGGTAVMLGVPGFADEASFNVSSMYLDKGVLGCRYGSSQPQRDIRRYVELYQQGRLKLDELVSAKYPLGDIEKAVHAMESGELAARGVLQIA